MDTVLTDGRIVLRPVGPELADKLYEAGRESIADVFPFLPWCHPEYSFDEARDWAERQPAIWKSGEAFNFGIFDDGDGRYLGGVGINAIVRLHHMANLGYWTRTSAAGRGVATAATILCARWGIETLDLKRIEIVASVENIASCRVAEKAGAFREGVLRNRLYLHGRPHDAVMHSVVP